MNTTVPLMDEGWLVFDQEPSEPTFAVPSGAVDAHCHVFGPASRFPYAPERKYTPADAPKEKLWELRDLLGFERNVIVQASCHGRDNRALVDALHDSEGRARGVAVIEPSVSDAELAMLNDAGVRGVRFNYLKRLASPPRPEVVDDMARRVDRLGWHIVLYFEAPDLPDLVDHISSLQAPVVIDHMGRPDVSLSPEGPQFQLLLQLMDDNDHIWCKVSCPERLSISGPPDYNDVVPFAKKVVERFPDRILWGTDWPHPNMKSHMPDDGKLVDLIPRIATTDALQAKLLVDNPLRLYWPEQTSS